MALAVLVVALQGCVSTRPVWLQGHGGDADGLLSEINERASTHHARLFLTDGRRLTVGSLRVQPDSTSWVADGRHEAVATTEVARIQFVGRGRGALEGLGVGLLGGIVVGGVAGFSGYDGPSFLSESRAENAVIGAALLSCLTAPLGLVFGVSEGHLESYEFRDNTAE